MTPMPDTRRRLGVCYYPEHWPEERWALDAAQMVEAGLSWVRIGEFSWSRLEPVEGDLRWDWLDRAVKTLGDAGLQIIMGTPSATPPRWVLDKYPDMLALDAYDQPRKFGSRRHYCFSHDGFRDEAVRIARQMAERYGRNPAVQAWQIDNEYGCHDTTRSYSDAACAGFRNWLSEKYGQIDALNAAWGNVFWSMEYRTYDEVDLPNQTVTEANPAHWLDFHRFSSDQVVAFNRAQAGAIRAVTDAPLIHNYMGRTVEFDHFAVGADLDVASWDSYPLGFLEDRSDEGAVWTKRFMRQGDPDFQAFHHDLYRSVGRGRWWVMEQQPGPVNWAPYNPSPLAGMARLWAWEAFAHGAEAVCYFRWRQAPFAQEQMHAGLLRSDAAPAPALAEATQVARELAELPDVALPRPRVALIFDYESAWAWSVQPQGRDFDYFRLVFEVYRALRRSGQMVDILPPCVSDLSDYAVVFAPGLMHWPDGLRAQITDHKGLCVVGPRSGSKTDTFSIPDAMPPDLPAAQVLVERVESLRADAPVALEGGGAFHIWREEISGSATVLERSQDGQAAVTESGNIRYLAGWPDPVAMLRLVKTALLDADLPVIDMPEGVRFADAGSTRFVFNYDAVPVDLGEIQGLKATQILSPGDVAWVAI